VQLLLGANLADSQTEQEIRNELGLNLSLQQQYFNFWKNLAFADLGQSFRTKSDVVGEIKAHLPPTIRLTVLSLCLGGLITTFSSGVLFQLRHSWIGGVLLTLLTSVNGIPVYLLASSAFFLFISVLRLVPTVNSHDWAGIVLPAVVLGSYISAYITRLSVAALEQAVQAPHILMLHVFGISPVTIWGKHLLKAISSTVITAFSVIISMILSGNVIIENVFGIAGIGRLLVSSVQGRDYPMVQGCVIFIGAVFLTLNLFADISNRILYPKLEHDK
jgi:peptide/nickel transport system permease protein